MHHIPAILVAVFAVGVLIWLLVPSSSPSASEERGGELLDPSDSRQIGMLVGMTGGNITDAAAARFALQRFEQMHGRKATTRDVGIVVGLMREITPPV